MLLLYKSANSLMLTYYRYFSFKLTQMYFKIDYLIKIIVFVTHESQTRSIRYPVHT